MDGGSLRILFKSIIGAGTALKVQKINDREERIMPSDIRHRNIILRLQCAGLKQMNVLLWYPESDSTHWTRV